MERIQRVIAWGGEPYAQPLMKLNALERRPHVRFDWTERQLKQVQRWVNRHIWKSEPDFARYDASCKSADQPDAGQTTLPLELVTVARRTCDGSMA